MGFQNMEDYLQLLTVYIKSVPDPQVALQMLTDSAQHWVLLQHELLSLGPVALWTQRRTLLMVKLLQLQTAWLNSHSQACIPLPEGVLLKHVLLLCPSANIAQVL